MGHFDWSVDRNLDCEFCDVVGIGREVAPSHTRIKYVRFWRGRNLLYILLLLATKFEPVAL